MSRARPAAARGNPGRGGRSRACPNGATGESLLTLESPVDCLSGIGPVRSKRLGEGGIATVRDLLYHLPHRYEDRSQVTPPAAIAGEGTFTVRGRLEDVVRIRARRRGMVLVRGRVVADGAELPVVWFNQPYLADRLVKDRAYILHGRVRRRGEGLELLNPSCEPDGGSLHGGRIVPIYPALGSLGPALMRRLVDGALSRLDLHELLPDDLPGELRRYRGLPPLAEALTVVHRPPSGTDVSRLNDRSSNAHRRLFFGELVELQLELALVRRRWLRQVKGHRYSIDSRLRELMEQLLPFRLTEAQRRVMDEILEDLRGDAPMLRLLQGEVGSGKTIVAILALVAAMESGLQGAFMAPTEILAEQQHRVLMRLLGERYRLGLVTSSAPDLERTRRELAEGRVRMAVGTQALIQKSVAFRRLGLVVVDEQHRFGVAQRQSLSAKGERPDVLVMTATPIPRSLCLTLYGDLALSVVDELPPGRLPVQTRVVPLSESDRVYAWLGERVEEGDQAYVVFPLIEGSERVAAGSIAHGEERVREAVGEARCAVLHGRVVAEEREEVMRRFAAGELRVLIATSLVEVGLDVPQATIMVIESAERFGLAQLHQLRGRVGRGAGRSHCVAIHGRLSDEARRRLAVFAETTNGFRVAEADLAIRGPGDLLGTRQAGASPSLWLSDLLAHPEWIERARADARELLAGRWAPEAGPLIARVEPRARARYHLLGGG